MERSIVGYLIFMEVLLGAWASNNSTCPYDNPATHAMTCIRDMPSVTYKHVSFQPRSTTAATNAKSSTAANRKRQAETADDKHEEGVSPMRTPEISLEFMQYFCRAVAGTYNCFAEIGGEACGQDIARFSIAVMRTMESRYCTPIVDARYKQPVSSSATILPTILTFVVAVLNFIF